MTNRDESTKSRILETAGPIFAEKGFRGATVRDICEKANVNLASINYYFGDKAQLYREAVLGARDSVASAAPFLDTIDDLPAKERLFHFVKTLMDRLGIGSESSWQNRLLVNEFLNPGEPTQKIVEAYFKPYFEKLISLLQEVAESDLDRSQQLQLGFSVIGQCLYYVVSRPMVGMFIDEEDLRSQFTTEKLAWHVTNLTLSGLAGIQSTVGASSDR